MVDQREAEGQPAGPLPGAEGGGSGPQSSEDEASPGAEPRFGLRAAGLLAFGAALVAFGAVAAQHHFAVDEQLGVPTPGEEATMESMSPIFWAHQGRSVTDSAPLLQFPRHLLPGNTVELDMLQKREGEEEPAGPFPGADEDADKDAPGAEGGSDDEKRKHEERMGKSARGVAADSDGLDKQGGAPRSKSEDEEATHQEPPHLGRGLWAQMPGPGTSTAIAGTVRGEGSHSGEGGRRDRLNAFLLPVLVVILAAAAVALVLLKE